MPLLVKNRSSRCRFLSGSGMGLHLSVVTVYISEIATTDMRGLLGCLVQIMGCSGIIASFCAGVLLDWKWLAAFNGVFVLPFAGLVAFVPESPRWLLMKGRQFSAVRALEWLRGKDDRAGVEAEVQVYSISRDIDELALPFCYLFRSKR